MSKEELISIVIPTYKRRDELERALKSIASQTYSNLETIVVDDNAGNLDYRASVEKIVSRFSGVKLVKNRTNLGGALSRNAGVKKAQGELIAFLDDDDEYTPDRIKKQYELYLEHKKSNPGLIFCNNATFDPSVNAIYQHMCKIIATTSTWLIPKKVIEDLGYFEQSPSEQDTIFVLKLLCDGYKVFGIPDELVVRHGHTSSQGITGVGERNIIGTEKLRQKCRANYDKLDDVWQIKDVEYYLSAKLLPKYIFNRRKKDARREIKNLVATKPFSVTTLKGVLRYCFPRIFVFNWKWNK